MSSDLDLIKVSIVMPAFNAAKSISESIESVLAQTHQNFELIVVDDCSCDNTIDVVNSFNYDDRLKLLSTDINSGPSIARNVGISFASGAYIAFLDADDKWCKEKIEYQLKYIARNKLLFCATGYSKFRSNGDLVGHVVPTEILTAKSILSGNDIGCLTVMYNRKYYMDCYFEPLSATLISILNLLKIKITILHEDYALWLRMLSVTPKGRAGGYNVICAHYRVSDNSYSSNKIHAVFSQIYIYIVVAKLSLPQVFYYTIRYLYRGIKCRV